MNETENAARLYGNIQVLLSEGTFAGKYAAPLAEAQQFVQSMIEKLKEQPSVDAKQEAGSSNRSEEGAGGLGVDPVRDPGRQSGERKTKRARKSRAGA